jgi:ketosteroid isomerase-like protein
MTLVYLNVNTNVSDNACFHRELIAACIRVLILQQLIAILISLNKITMIKRFSLILLLTVPLSCLAQSSPNTAAVTKCFDLLFRKGDFAGLSAVVSADAVYTQAEGLPYGGKYNGLQNWGTMFQKVQSYFDLQVEGEPVYFENVKANQVIVNFHVKFTSKKSNQSISMPIAELYDLKNGKIVGVTPYYFDTKKIVEFVASP